MSLLSVVGVHAIGSAALPDVGYVVTADLFFVVSYVVIMLTLVEVIAESRLIGGGREEEAKRLSYASRFVFPALYILPLGWIVFRSGW